MNISEILKAQACDNLPREVAHDNEAAPETQAVGFVSNGCSDSEDHAGDGEGDQELGMCPRCGLPVKEWQEYRHTYANNTFTHRKCLSLEEQTR